MKQLLFTFSLILFLSSYAQNQIEEAFPFTVSEPYEVFDGDKMYFNHNDAIINIKLNQDYLLIQKIDKESLKEVHREEHKLRDIFPKHWIKEGFNRSGSNFYIYYSSLEGGKNKKERLFVRKIDLNTASLIKDFNKLVTVINGRLPEYMLLNGARVKTIKKFNVWGSKSVEGQSSIPENEKLLTTYNTRVKVEGTRNKKKDIIGITVLDNDFEKIWSGTFELPYNMKHLYLSRFFVTSKGAVFAQGVVTKKMKEIEKPLKIFRFKKGAKMAELFGEYDINELGYSPMIHKVGDEQFLLVGRCGLKDDLDKTTAFSIVTLGEDGEVSSKSIYNITQDVFKDYMASRGSKKIEETNEQSKPVTAYPNYSANGRYHKDGSLTLMGQQFFHSFGANALHYNYHDILVTKISDSGELLWMRNLPRRLFSGTKLTEGYQYFYVKGKHYFIFLDSRENLKRTLTETPRKHHAAGVGCVTAFVVDDKTGEVKRAKVIDTAKSIKGMKLYEFRAGRVILGDNNDFYIEFYKKKKEDVMVKFTIE